MALGSFPLSLSLSHTHLKHVSNEIESLWGPPHDALNPLSSQTGVSVFSLRPSFMQLSYATFFYKLLKEKGQNSHMHTGYE